MLIICPSPTEKVLVGLADIEIRRISERVTVQAAWERVEGDLSLVAMGFVLRSMDEALDVWAGKYAVEMQCPEFRRAVRKLFREMTQANDLLFGGQDMQIAGTHSDGWAAGLADMLLLRLFPSEVPFSGPHTYMADRLAAAADGISGGLRAVFATN